MRGSVNGGGDSGRALAGLEEEPEDGKRSRGAPEEEGGYMDVST
jgi:hypothetical protein